MEIVLREWLLNIGLEVERISVQFALRMPHIPRRVIHPPHEKNESKPGSRLKSHVHVCSGFISEATAGPTIYMCMSMNPGSTILSLSIAICTFVFVSDAIRGKRQTCQPQ